MFIDEEGRGARSGTARTRVLSVPIALVTLVLIAINLRLVFGSSSAVVSDIRGAYHLGSTAVALLTTVPVLCLGFGGLLAPYGLRRLHVSTLLAVCLAVIVLGTVVRVVPSWPALMIGTVIAGGGIAVANVLGPVFIREVAPDRIGAMTGVFTATVSASAGVAAGVTVPLADAVGSWRHALALWCVPTLFAVGVVTIVAVRLRCSGARSSGEGVARAVPMSVVVRSPLAWAVTGFMGIQSLLAYALIAWLPTVHRDRGIDPAAAGLTVTVLSATSILTALAVPAIAARTTDQRRPALAVVALSVVGLIGVLLTRDAASAMVFAALLGLGQGGQLSLALTMVNLRSGDAPTAAAMSTMVQSVGYLIAAAGPLVIGAVHAASGGWSSALIVLLLLMLPLAACGWIAGRPRSVT